MNFNPTRTKYINQSPKLPRATGLVAITADASCSSAPRRRIGRGGDIKHRFLFDCCHQDSMHPICSAAGNVTQIESRRYPIAPTSNNTPPSPFFHESSYYGQEKENKSDRQRQGEQHYILLGCARTPSSQQPMSRRRKLDSMLKSVDDLLLKSSRRA
jgi:hypothetical protein